MELTLYWIMSLKGISLSTKIFRQFILNILFAVQLFFEISQFNRFQALQALRMHVSKKIQASYIIKLII